MKKEVKTIESFECKDWLLHKHYAKRMCGIVYSFGLYIDNVLSGVCTFGTGPSRALCVGVCGEENAHRGLELNRLCVNEGLLHILPSKHTNKTFRWIIKNLTFFK